MNPIPLTYHTLRREVTKQVVRWTFVQGQGGPLVFLWAVGLAALWLLGLPLMILVWTAAILVLAALVVKDALRSPKANADVVRKLLERRHPTTGLRDAGHREAIRQGIGVACEIITTVQGISRAGDGDGDDLLEAVSTADTLLSLQLASASQAEEFARVLRLIGASTGSNGDLSAATGVAAEAGEHASLRQANVEAVQREAAAAEEMVGTIGQRLETLMLQVLRMQTRAIDLVTSAEGQRESRESLERLQEAAVEARHWAARGLLDTMGVVRQPGD